MRKPLSVGIQADATGMQDRNDIPKQGIPSDRNNKGFPNKGCPLIGITRDSLTRDAL